MTALDSRPAADLDRPAPTGTALLGRDVPVLVSGTELFGAQPGSGYRVAPHLVRRVDGQVIQLTPLLYALLSAMDGARSTDEVAATAGLDLGRDLHPEDVQTLIDDKLRPLGLVL